MVDFLQTRLQKMLRFFKKLAKKWLFAQTTACICKNYGS
jgi:hypothetical protein